jgi:hypothetical protein
MNEKLCPICNLTQPLDDFGLHRGRPDGHNLYCKSCIRQKSNAQRTHIRTLNRARREFLAQLPERKPEVVSNPIVRFTGLDRVSHAIKQGSRTRDEIQQATGLSMDELCDLLADLWDEGAIVSQPVGEERVWRATA